MEEEKAAEYYDDLVRTGGNAAKFKQGLGFGTHTTAVPSSGAHNSLSNFVKAASPGRAAAISNEIRVESIRDKLKKRADDSSRKVGGPNQRCPDVDDTKPAHKSELRDSESKEKTNDNPRRLRRSSSEKSETSRKKSSGRESNGRSRSRGRGNRGKASRSPKFSSEESEGSPRKKSSDRSKRGRSRTRSKSKERRRRSRSLSRGNRGRYSRSPSHGHGKGKGRSDIDSRRRYSERRPRRNSSDDSIRRSSDTARKRNRRDRSQSPASYRHSSRNTYSRSRRSRSRSYERRRRDRSRSRSRGKESDYRRRDRAYSPYRSRRRERTRSPPARRSYSSHRENGASGRSDRRRGGSRDERPSSRHRDEKADKSVEHRSRKAKGLQPPDRDYSKIISNFDSMTPAEKVKAKTKLQLSEIVAKDHAMGMTGEWERFDFNNTAPLDGDTKMDDFGDGTGAADDTEFLKNTGSTYLSSSNQVSRENQVAATHESAIFGPPEGIMLRISQPEILASTPEEKDHSNGFETIERMIEDDDAARPPLDSVVSEQVINMQQATSWQERARKSREARAAALAS